MLCGVVGTVDDVINLKEREAGFGPNPETATGQCRNGPMGHSTLGQACFVS